MKINNYSFKASYGTFNLNMNPINTIDVTEIVASRFLNESKITIPAKLNFNDAFGDPEFGKVKFLQIELNGRKHNIIEDDYTLDIPIHSEKKASGLIIVYYVYINRNSNWRGIISGQLLQLKSYGVLDEADLYIHITDTQNSSDDVELFINELVCHVTISRNKENLFEYPAIRQVYELAKQFPDAILIYLHSKAMSYNIYSRRIDEEALLTKTFENWRKSLEIFSDKKINKIGLFPSIGSNNDTEKQGTRGGWIWYNFWYARASYIINCDEPKPSHDRYFFEHWLGLQNGQLTINNDCANLYKHKNKTYFTPEEAVNCLNELIRTEMTRY